MSSIKPDHAGRQINGGEEVACGLIVTGCDRAVLFEFGEEVLNQVTSGVEMAIQFPGLLPIGLGWDHRLLSGGHQRLDDTFVGVVGLVGDQRIGFEFGQEFIGTDEIMGLAAGQTKSSWITERIDPRMDLGAQSAARPPDRLVLAIFFWAPALC